MTDSSARSPEIAAPSPPPDRAPALRLEFLDALRGVAAAMVVVEHLLADRAPWSRFLNLGRVGVIAFFAISGFVIPLSLGGVRRPGGFVAFWIGRAFRILPVYWLSLLAVAFTPSRGAASASDWAANVFLLQLPLGRVQLNPVAWTLIIELLLYVFLSLAALRAGVLERPVRTTLCALGGLFSLGVAAPLLIGARAPAGLVQCLVASAVGYAWLARYRGEMGARTVAAITFGALAVATAATYVGTVLFVKAGDEINLPFAAAANAGAAGIALFLAAYALRERRMPRLLLWLGALSYPWYLFHGWTLPYAWRAGTPIAAAGAILGGIGLAAIVRAAVETPMNKLGRRLRDRVLARS